ncbi:TPA: hypothetical protein DCG82_01005 [candidate division WOR-3]|uniref:Uncharacterized protein n=1 Tax=candidate division WOR-3 bacterium TaxID=2052148 RepID=A0A348MIU8_UNCW3|nr:hypothetical protein [candidate division WOR-3 bacterium]HCP16888.1 hypothetical protein [candidate division WOR-3 bacterium]
MIYFYHSIIILLFFINLRIQFFNTSKIDKILSFINISNIFVLILFLFSDFKKLSNQKALFIILFFVQICLSIKFLFDNFKEV